MPPPSTPGDEVWPEGPITAQQADRYAAAIAGTAQERTVIARNLLDLPPELKIRGFFFDGMCQVVKQKRDPETLSRLQRTAGVPQKLHPFGQYMVRDFYKLYYHAAAVLHEKLPFPEAIRRSTQHFFPIFKTSMIGKTVSAFMGSKPSTIIPVVAKAYTVSVEGNEHQVVPTGAQEMTWRCTVEPVSWYPESLQGIIEGALPAGQEIELKTIDRVPAGKLMRYSFRIRW